jgi:hypothetical protein
MDESVLHLLNADQSLMIGTGGQSFTLYAVDKTEELGDRSIALSRPSASYKIDAASTGPNVFAIFEGRTPGRGIARQLGLGDDRGRLKAKWRLTLYQDPDTKQPTTYKIEGTLFRQQVRSGTWDIVTAESNGAARTIYRLQAANGQPELQLQKGDDNVLFFLDAKQKLLVGHADFSYTLNIRQAK